MNSMDQFRMPTHGVREDLAFGAIAALWIFLLCLILFTFLSRQVSILPQKGITPQYAISDWGVFH